jgi:hypothetical protein
LRQNILGGGDLNSKMGFFGAKLFNLFGGLAIYVTTHGESKYTFENFFDHPPNTSGPWGPI